MVSHKHVSYVELDEWLGRTPIIGKVHPLLPLCLKPGTEIVTNSVELLERLDSQHCYPDKRLLILSQEAAIHARFPEFTSYDHPPVEAINTHIANNLEYARHHLITSHTMAAHIENEVANSPVDVVVVLLVDGLSYGDVLGWDYEVLPCFIDGPSVTYRFLGSDRSQLATKVGFPSIINTPSIYSRLYHLGFRHARGYTYWNSENSITDFMFSGIPQQKVANFEGVIHLLNLENIAQGTYIQIVREGLDGLAHGKRELYHDEIDAAIQGLLYDLQRIMRIIETKKLRAYIFLTSDHGILWKNEHAFRTFPEKETHPRYSENRLLGQLAEYAVRFENGEAPYYLFTYPYLGAKIPANDSGVHGGLSYQESIVPFLKIRV